MQMDPLEIPIFVFLISPTLNYVIALAANSFVNVLNQGVKGKIEFICRW